jgi:hypothetical protein
MIPRADAMSPHSTLARQSLPLTGTSYLASHFDVASLDQTETRKTIHPAKCSQLAFAGHRRIVPILFDFTQVLRQTLQLPKASFAVEISMEKGGPKR